ncbi:hypothetical protein ACFQ3N_14705 [Virgibacillus byunsanensis]|uniref:Uncharacterized protein n=1 Tax=Virgibacillus byunsanensis TaxID=570945 RepID=A0ABW3LPR9_9BACI
MGESLAVTEEEIKKYYELSKQKKEVEQELNHLKNKFHQFLDESIGKNQKGEIHRGNYKVQRQIRSSTSYHDEETVKTLEELNLADFIITLKRPDTDKLKSAFKLGLVEEEAFEHCTKTKLTQALVTKETFSN